MTRKDFKLIAEVLKNSRPVLICDDLTQHRQWTIDLVTEEFADVLEQTNPRFKKDTFMRAAGFSQG